MKLVIEPVRSKRRSVIEITSDIYPKLAQILEDNYHSRKVLLIIDQTVFAIYDKEISQPFAESSLQQTFFKIPGGEATKSVDYLLKGYKKLIENNFSRDDLIIAIGGGTVGDLAGYLASTYQRGISYIQVPTTLLAQIDSSVGGKTAINYQNKKNVIGSIYHPDQVLIDLKFLETLTNRDFNSGLGELIKYALLDNNFYHLLNKSCAEIIKRNDFNQQLLSEVIYQALRIKNNYVRFDQDDFGKRRMLNLGHTLGHALESYTDFKDYRHGEGVIIGIVFAAYISLKENRLSSTKFDEILSLIKKFNFDFNLPKKLDVSKIIELMKSDKKVRSGKINFILLKDIGEPFVTDQLTEEKISDYLEDLKCLKLV